mgnify:CR=1 FL=1
MKKKQYLAYIIANVKIKEGNKWLGGRIVEQLGQPGAFADKKWKTFEEFPWLTLSESEVKKFKKVPTSNFIELFQNWQLRKVPQYVNEAIVNWGEYFFSFLLLLFSYRDIL